MIRIHAYKISKFPRRILLHAKWHFVIFVLLLSFLPSISSIGQDYPPYEEMTLFVDVPNLGGRDMDMLILDNEVYLPITDLFDFLMIRNIPSQNLDTITGFFINQEATYLIDREKYQIRYAGQLFELNPSDLIRTETNLYLRGFYFGHIFGLDSEFNFRTMSVRINPRMELPAIREMKLQAMRKNMKRLVGEEEADTTIGRNYPFFHFGMADWSANLTEDIDGQVDSRLSLALGSMLAGGEATVVLNYNSFTPFTEKQQHYLWRYVNNDNRAVRQVMLGKIATGATSSIFDPVVGAKVTNSSTKFRRSFGTYTLSDRTEPEWIVELYVNNVLVDYTTADASGFFTFQVPLVYGNTNVRLKFYGPYGEERVREQNITIPFNFIPKKTFEYSVSGGIVEDGQQSRFSRADAFYGLTSSITLGTGVEYLSSITSGQVMPFVNGSFRLASNLLLSGEYSPEVRSKGTLTYRLPSSLQFDINYIYYTKEQKAIKNIYREERKFSMSMPIRLKNFSVYNRLSIHQLVLPTTNYTTTEWLISGALYGVSANITTYGVFIGNTNPYFYSDISMAFRLPKNITLQPRMQYSYTNSQVLSAKILAEKRLFKKGYLTASYEQNFRSDMYMVEFGFRYDLKFAQTNIGTRHTNRTTTFIQYARGSIVNDSKNNYIYTDNRSNVGKGAISIIPFLDKNANGTRDPGEPKVYGLNLRANAGRIERREKDTTIRIFGLEPYTDCFIEFEQSSLDNIAWRLQNLSMNIAVDPNMVKLVEVPINVVGEAAGMVRIDHKGVVRGIARLIVNIYNKDQKRIGRTLTEDDGYFSYFGLYPGAYEARIDSAQLGKLGMFSIPDSVDFNIEANIDGDYVDGLDFMVKYDTIKQILELGTIDMIIHEEIRQDLINSRNSYAIEIGAFENEAEADAVRDQLSTLLGKEVILVPMDGLYKVRITGFETKVEAEESYPALQSIGVSEIGLITLQGTLEPRLYTIIPGIDTDTVISLVENDTTILIVHKIVNEDTTSSKDSYAIDIGAFENEVEAGALRDQLSSLLGKEVILVPENGLYKVSITGLETKVEAEESYPALQSIGISEIGLITLKGILNSTQTTSIPDAEINPAKTISAVVIAHEIIKEDISSSTDSYAIEVGAFKNESEAAALRDQLSTLLAKEVSLFPEDDLYKVRITGLQSMDEVEETLPLLQSNRINTIGLITFKGILSPAEIIDIPADETFSEIVITYEKIKEDTTSSSNSYIIEIEAFKNESEAVALRDQLSILLGKKVSLFPEDDLYKVRITGLDTKDEVEETFPVLISKGINEIGLITFKGMLETDKDTNITGIETGQDETLTEKPTTVVVVNEKIKEDTTSSTDSYTIEIGAFKNESEAAALRDQYSTLLGKEVSLFPEDDLYKVRITGLDTKDEVEETFPVLLSNGISKIGLITFKGMLNPVETGKITGIETGTVKTHIEKESTGVTIHEIFEEDMTSSTDSYAIQLGAFKRKENATNLKKKLGSSLGKEVNITAEGEFNKVRVTGFKSSYEVERYIPTLVKQGIREIWVVTLKGTLKPDLVGGEPDIHREVLNTLTKKDTSYLIVHDVFEEVITTGSESYAIQLGAFNRKINADALRIKLATILGRDVKIFVEDDLYNVRITGFETQDEVESYLSVLLKNGISETSILMLKGKQNYRTAISRLDTISGTIDKVSDKGTTYIINKEPFEEVKKATPDSAIIISKTITPGKKKEELPLIPSEVKAKKKTEVKKTPVEVSKVEEPKQEIVEVPYEVERKKTLEERLLVAEYRSGLYESRWPGVEFTIQIAASKSISDPEEIKKKFGLSGKVEVVKMGEWYRFTTGSYIKYWQAREYRNILRSRVGIDDAFVVAHRDGKRIMLTDLVAMTESTTEARTGITVRPAISKGFSVQILATKDGNLSVSDIRDKYEIDDDVYKEYNENDGLYRYSIGNFSTYTGAVKVRNKIRAKGFRDAFVVGYKDGKRVKDLKSILE